MAAFTQHKGTIAVLPDDNIDTDRIIPARFLTMVTRSGYGELLFNDVRGGEFALDQPEAKGASVLIVGSNFGCGSSREHAVWAIQQAGYQAVIAKRQPSLSGFSDIFRQNAANCGLLLVELDEEAHAKLANLGSGTVVEIDLPNDQIRFEGGSIGFEIPPALKKQHLEGLDLIGTTLLHAADIDAYERERLDFVPPRV